MSKADCSIVLVGVADFRDSFLLARVSFDWSLAIFQRLHAELRVSGSDRQDGDFFLAFLFCLVVIGFVMIMRAPEEAERGDGDELPK